MSTPFRLAAALLLAACGSLAAAQETSLSVDGNMLLKLSRKPSTHPTLTGVMERKLEFVGPAEGAIETARSDFYGSLALYQDSAHVAYGMGPNLSLHTDFPDASLSRHFYVSLGDPHNTPGTASTDVILQSWDGAFATHMTHMVLKANGNVGIGALNPTHRLEVGGAVAATSFVNLSSREFKEGIEEVAPEEQGRMLDALAKMGIARYRYKAEVAGSSERHIGFIAEELPADVLAEDGKAVDVYELLTYTIGAVKAQQRRIEQLEKQLAASHAE